MNDNELFSIVVAQKCSSALSILGSGFILQEILRDRKKRSTVIHRLLASMSFSDVLCSIWFFIGTWAIPRGTPGYPNAVGTEATCKAQAFVMYGALTTLNFNACLALYYLVSIRYGWTEATIRKYVEPACYIYAVGLGVCVGTVPLVKDIYGPATFWCSVQPSVETGTQRIWLLFYGPAWFVLVFVTAAMIAIYRHVLVIEQKVERYDFAKRISSKSKKKKQDIPAFSSSATNHHQHVLSAAEDDDSQMADINTQNNDDPQQLKKGENEGGIASTADNTLNRGEWRENQVRPQKRVSSLSGGGRRFSLLDIALRMYPSTTKIDTGSKENTSNDNNIDDSRTNENSSNYKNNSNSKRKRKHSQKVAIQALFYCLAFYLTLAFATLTRAMQAFKGSTPYAILLLFMIFYPLQGFMNFVVYMRPRWTKYLLERQRRQRQTQHQQTNASNCQSNVGSSSPGLTNNKSTQVYTTMSSVDLVYGNCIREEEAEGKGNNHVNDSDEESNY